MHHPLSHFVVFYFLIVLYFGPAEGGSAVAARIKRPADVFKVILGFTCFCDFASQWRRQDLLRGGAKLEIMSWGTHGELQGLDD